MSMLNYTGIVENAELCSIQAKITRINWTTFGNSAQGGLE